MLKWFKKSEESAPAAPSGEPAAAPSGEATPAAGEGKGLFSRLKDKLAKTNSLLADRLSEAIGFGAIVDRDFLERVEEILIMADVGGRTAEKVVKRIRDEGLMMTNLSSEVLLDLVKKTIVETISANERPLDWNRPAPFVILIAGVNGVGKTTTIGKLALQMSRAGKRVMMVAADTFRAAAADQLAIWAERSGAGLVRKEEGADPAAVCHEALDAARKDPPDVILIDTAGRLHTKSHLMAELDKIIRVTKKIYPDAPHETILIIDATTGQNALNQVATFREIARVTGLIVTKLDGTAKGGVLVAVKEAHPLPIFRIGVGESPEDLRSFDPEDYAAAILTRREPAA